MSAEELRSKIVDLKFIVTEVVAANSVSPSDPYSAKDLAENVKLLCEEVSPMSKQFSYFVSLLFLSSDEDSLFNVVKLYLKLPQFEDTVAICIESLALIVLKSQSSFEPYVPTTVQLCLRVMKQESLKSKREVGYELLIAILDVVSACNFSQNLVNVDEIVTFCLNLLGTIKKSENSGVKKGLYQLMGILCRFYPEKLLQPKKNLGFTFGSVLGAELKLQMASISKAPVLSVLEGCFVGLNGLLCNFSDVLETTGKMTLRQLYDYCKTICLPEYHLPRHAPMKAALTLLIEHSVLFKDFFLPEYKALFDCFQTLAMHSDREVKSLGFRSTEMLLRQIADAIPDLKNNNANEAMRVYKFFVDKFRSKLVQSTSMGGVRETSLAVKGLGYFANATKVLLGEEDLLKLLRDITNRSEQIFLNSPEPLEQKVTYLPQFLEAIANTLLYLTEVPVDVWPSIETMHVLLYQHFPLLDKKYVHNAVFVSLRIISAAEIHNFTYLDRIVHQTLIRLFSLTPSAVIQQMEDEVGISLEDAKDPKKFTYKEYLPLWSMLVSEKSFKKFGDTSLNDTSCRIFSAAIRICLEIASRLDLETETIIIDDEEEESEELTVAPDRLANFKPKQRNDFWIFVNMVDFIRDLLTKIQPKQFEPWISSFVRNIIELSTKFPLVSGFYKLLTSSLSLANQIEFFSKIDDEASSERSQTGELVAVFVTEILVRIQKLKDDELLLSCLELVLNIPLQLVQLTVSSLSHAVKVSLKLGLSYLPLAEKCIDTLEMWNKSLDVDVLKPFYNEILPYLDEYLNSEQFRVNDELAGDVQKIVRNKRKKTAIDKKKIVEQVEKAKNAEAESKLIEIRLRILQFIGQLGGEINYRLIEFNQQHLAQLCTTWDTQEHLQYDVPFCDMKPTIVLDKFLPRICALATMSGDRQTKIAACESLHSIMLYMLGHSSQQNVVQRDRYPMHKLYRRLFPVLLKLSCDADEVPRELFRNLVDQIIHWFSGSASHENPETVALLDSLLESTENLSESALCEYSARCLNEFLKWSIKHSTAANKGSSEHNIRSLLKRLYSFAIHPSPHKRLASSLIFNAIYQTFREESDLVNKYTFELLVAFLNSLALAHSDDESEGTAAQCVMVIKHLERHVLKLKDLFLKKNSSRRIPLGWRDSTLEECVRWLFEQIGRTPMEFRQKCFELFEKLSPLLITVGGPRQYFGKEMQKSGLHERFEGAANSSYESGICTNPVLQISSTETTLLDVLRWLDCLMAALDCYFATLNGALVDVEVLFSDDNLKKMKLFTAISYFVESLISKDLAEMLPSSVYSPRETKKFINKKCTVFVRLLQFYATFLNRGSESFLTKLPKFVWPVRLFVCALECCMDATKFGFDVTMKSTVVELPLILRHFMKEMCRKLPENVKQSFNDSYLGLLSNEYKFVSLTDVLSKKCEKDAFFVKKLYNGYSLLHSSNVLPKFQSNGSEMWRMFVKACVLDVDGELCLREWTPIELNVAKTFLKFAAEMNIKASDLVSAIVDSTPVRINRLSKSMSPRGLSVFDQFAETICTIIVENGEHFVSNLVGVGDQEACGIVLSKVLDVLGKNTTLRKSYGEKFIKLVTEKCSLMLHEWVFKKGLTLKTLWVTVVHKLWPIDSKIFINISPVSDMFFESFCHLLADKETNLNFKNKVLKGLALFASPQKTRDEKLKEALNKVVVQHFPLKSTEFSKGSEECDEYLTSIRLMIGALPICHNPVILEILTDLLCRESKHLDEDDIMARLRAYSKSISFADVLTIISVPFNVFYVENSHYSDEHRLNALEKLFLPMLVGLDPKLLKHFCLLHLNEFVEKLDSSFSRGSDAIYKRQLITKLGCWNCLEHMYATLDANVLKGEINEKFVGKTSHEKTELIKKLFKILPEARKEGKYDTSFIHLKWKFRCAAHNCLVSILSATQTKATVFEGYIFKDAWDCISEPEKKYSFDIEVSSYPTRQRQILSSRRTTSSDDSDDAESVNFVRSNSTLQFLSSQVLAESSLRSELASFDFTSSLGVSQNFDDKPRRVNVLTQSSRSKDLKNGEAAEDSAMELEVDDLNLHPSMAITIRVIKFLVDSNITPTDGGEIPGWMKLMLKHLESSDINTKLFIGRVISLLEEIFRPFAQHFIMPLIRLFLDSECGASGIHAFRVDVITTLLGWAPKVCPEKTELSKHMCSELLEYFMVHAPSPNSAVLRRNILLLNLMLDLWKNCFIVEPSLLLKYLASPDKVESNIGVGIQILGVILRNRLNPLGMCDEEAKKFKLYGSLVNHLENKSARIYKPAAEVVGLALKFMTEGVELESLQVRIQTVLGKISQQGTPGRYKFLECLHLMQRYFPKFSDWFFKDVIVWLPSVHGHYKVYCLEIIWGRAEQFSTHLFEDLKTKGLQSLLVIRDDTKQLWTLRILKKLTDKLSINDVQDLLPNLANFSDHPNTECRFIATDIFIRLYDIWTIDGSDNSRFIVETAREYLLKMLNDGDVALRQIVYNFWSHDTRLSTDTTKRLTNIFSLTYNANTERDFLAHATYLLLELTSKSPDFKREMFARPLTECKFEDFKIVTSWRRRYASLQTPAFADSQVLSTLGTEIAGGVPELRATMVHAPLFTQTQQAGGKTYDWMIGGSYDTYAQNEGDESSDSEIFAQQKKSRFKSLRPVPHDFGQKRLAAPIIDVSIEVNFEDDDVKNELKRLKKRILKDRTQAGYMFARMENRRQQFREKLDTERKTAREQNVQLYRTYRVGDFPDIQIPHSALLTPLQAVAQRDPIVASLLFESVMSGIYLDIRKNEADDAIDNTTKLLSSGIESIFKSSTIYFRPLISSLFMFCYRNASSVHVDMMELKNAALNGGVQHLGVVLVEKYLAAAESDESVIKQPPEKRMRRVKIEPSVSDAYWIELAKIYKSLDDAEIVRAIFSEHLNTKEITRKAFDCEARCSYAEAVTFYSDALKQHWLQGDSHSDFEIAEAECWEESRLKCLNELINWKDLANVVERSIDSTPARNLSKVWEDQYLQETYLPYLLHSKLKLVIGGDVEHKSIIDFVESSCHDPEKKIYLEERHTFSLALISFMKQEHERTNYECSKLLRKRLRDWSSLTSVDFVAKRLLLQEVQCLTEMTHYLKFQAKKNNDFGFLLELLDFWLRHSPNILFGGADVWDDVLTLRSLYVEEACGRMSKSKGSSKDDMYAKTFPLEIRMKLQFAESAALQRNFDVAFLQLKSIKEMVSFIGKSGGNELLMEYCRRYAETQFLFNEDKKCSYDDEIQRLMTVWSLFENVADSRDNLELRARTVEKIGWIVFDALQKNGTVPAVASQNIGRICSIDEKLFSKEKEPASVFLRSAFDLYKRCGYSKSVVDFCDNVLRIYEDDNGEALRQAINASDFADALIENLLMAIRDGCPEARRMFPRLLQILELFPTTSPKFIKLTEEIPCWMFLGWLNQIVALLDNPVGLNLFHIVEKIADEYPQALVYPFMLSKENYVFLKGNSKQRDFVERLNQKMQKVPLMKQLIRNFNLLSKPEALLKDFSAEVESYKVKHTLEELKSFLKVAYDEIFLNDCDEKEYGDFWKEFLEFVKPKLDEKFGENFEAILKQPLLTKDIFGSSRGWIKQLQEQQHKNKKSNPHNQLKYYSLWLAEFNESKNGNVLEIPGQYNDDRKPIPAYHVYISGFHSEIKVFHSIRSPISLTFLGNDGAEYRFLVKNGEDLRQDQRIEQIFTQMNGILAKSPKCRAKGANIRTYGVIPLTTKLGLIEIVAHAESLKEFRDRFLTTEEKVKCSDKIFYLKKFFGDKFFCHDSFMDLMQSAHILYFASYSKFPNSKAVDCLSNAQNYTPKLLLKNGILRLCSSPEAFYILRDRFSVSYAVMCMAHYLLGVGDRHLGNSMIDASTAELVGIDFGYVFGTSIQLLAIPELMPFRLTKMISDMFDPVGVHGLPESVMQYCMKAFRENAKLLLNTMDVFVKEPALNWTQEAKRQLQLQNENSPELNSDFSWYPRKKMEIVRRKLNGDNPVTVIERELRSARANQILGKAKFPLEKVVEVVYGVSKSPTDEQKKRPRGYELENLLVEDQVSCLLEMASDQVILSRVYYGWEPWM